MFEQANATQILGKSSAQSCMILRLKTVKVLIINKRNFPNTYVLAKLRELNSNAPEDHRMSDEVLGNLEKLLITVSDTKNQDQPTAEQISILWRTSHWPEGNTHAWVTSRNDCFLSNCANYISRESMEIWNKSSSLS